MFTLFALLVLYVLYTFFHWLWQMNADRRARLRGFANREDEEYVEWLKECERDFEHKRHLRERYLNS